MFLKLTIAKTNEYMEEKAALVNIDAVAYIHSHSVGYRDKLKAVIQVPCTIIVFNSATHDDMNSMYVKETVEQIDGFIQSDTPW